MSQGQVVPANRSEMVQHAKDNFILKLELEAENTPNMFGDEIAMAILNARTQEELDTILNAQGLPSSKDIVGIEHQILDISLQKGNPEFDDGGFGYYWLVDAVKLSDGSSLRYSAGGKSAVVTMWKWREFERIPGIEVVAIEKAATVGSTILFREVPKRAVKGKAE